MALPSKLKNMNIFINGDSYFGEASEVTPPKLTRQTEEWRGAGMDMPIKIDMGMEAMECEITIGGIATRIDRLFGAVEHDSEGLRIMGAYQDDDSGLVTACEIVVRGRIEEIDRGSMKPGDDTEHKYKVACSYYREIVDNQTIVEVDAVNGVFRVNGVDRYADIRSAIGA